MPLILYPGYMIPGVLSPDPTDYANSDFRDPANEPWHNPDPSDDALSAQPTWDMNSESVVPVDLQSYSGTDFIDPVVDNLVDPADDIFLAQPIVDVDTNTTQIPVALSSYTGSDFRDPAVENVDDQDFDISDDAQVLSLFDSDPWTNIPASTIIWDGSLDWLDAFDVEDDPDADQQQYFDADPWTDHAIDQPTYFDAISDLVIEEEELPQPQIDDTFVDILIQSPEFTDWLAEVEEDLQQYFDSDPWTDHAIDFPFYFDFDDPGNVVADDPDADQPHYFDSDPWVDHDIDVPQYFEPSATDQPVDDDDLSVESALDPGIDTLADQAATFDFTDPLINEEEEAVVEFSFEPWTDYSPVAIIWDSTLDDDDVNNELAADPDDDAQLAQPLDFSDPWVNIPVVVLIWDSTLDWMETSCQLPIPEYDDDLGQQPMDMDVWTPIPPVKLSSDQTQTMGVIYQIGSNPVMTSSMISD